MAVNEQYRSKEVDFWFSTTDVLAYSETSGRLRQQLGLSLRSHCTLCHASGAQAAHPYLTHAQPPVWALNMIGYLPALAHAGRPMNSINSAPYSTRALSEDPGPENMPSPSKSKQLSSLDHTRKTHHVLEVCIWELLAGDLSGLAFAFGI